MAAKYILGVLAIAFLFAALRNFMRAGGTFDAQSRTWLLIAAIFAAVSTWLFLAQRA
jgi:NO-binding membrane sensor protein with MHYT domain